MRLLEGERIIHELRPEPGIIIYPWLYEIFPLILLFAFPISILFVLEIGDIYVEIAHSFLGDSFIKYSQIIVLALTIIPGILFIIFTLLLARIYCKYLRKTYIYFITNRRCILQGGIILKTKRSIFYDKITEVSQSQTIFERWLGIGNIKIFTSDSTIIRPIPRIIFWGLKDTETPAETIEHYVMIVRDVPDI